MCLSIKSKLQKQLIENYSTLKMYLKNTQFLKLGVILGVNIATCWVLMLFAERKGFEPSIQLPVYYLSRVAPSTTRTPFYLRWQR